MTIAIRFDSVAKKYRLGVGQDTLREKLASLFKKVSPSQKQAKAEERVHWALKGVSFEIERGEALGIIGPNGAGKTTTLKTLARIIRPTSGTVDIEGKLSALIELGAGFHPDLTGRENVYLNGSILGLTRREIDERFDDIVAFSELARFIDTPVKRYSSGMYARLGFAVAVHVQPDILLVDEVLSVGDTAFQAKCHRKMEELKAQGTTLVFVSHNLNAVQRVCSRVLVLYQGQLAYDGPAAEAVAEYSNILRKQAAKMETDKTAVEKKGLSQRQMTQGARIHNVQLLNSQGEAVTVVRSQSQVTMVADIEFLEDAPSPIFACAIRDENGEVVYDTTTNWMGMETPSFKAGDWLRVEYALEMNLLDGIYSLGTDLAYADLSFYYDFIANALNFVVENDERARGVANLNANITFRKLDAPIGVQSVLGLAATG